MKIGLFVFQTGRSVDIAVLSQQAEQLGFASLWVPEHCIIPVRTTMSYRNSPAGSMPERYTRIVDPFVALARASAVTKTMRLGTGVCLVPERNPLLLAKEVATLDHLSGGRFMFGIGAGWLREETEIMGGDFPHRWSQTREAVLAMKQLWTRQESEFHGRYYDFPPVRSFPKPAQTPYPPVLLGGNAGNVFKRVVEWGDGWIPTRMPIEDIARGREALSRLAEERGRDPGSIQVVALGQPGEFRDRDTIGRLDKAGVDDVVIQLTDSEGDGTLEEVREIARQVI
jgi:probable F420-dependent oxidoreductase